MEYDPTNKSKFAHLTNNCIAQKYEQSPEKNSAKKPKKEREHSQEGGVDESEEEDDTLENIWSLDDFKVHLQKNEQTKFPGEEDIFQTVIYPQIMHQVEATCLSVQDVVNNRKNSFEFFGYDFMVDENLKVWLIEVNSSPSMDTKGQPVLQKLVKSVLHDLAKVVIDLHKDKNADIGGFQVVHKQKHEILRPKNNMETKLKVDGEKIWPPGYGPNGYQSQMDLISHALSQGHKPVI